MNGVAIVLELLAAHAPLTSAVPLDSIVAGDLSVGTTLPAIGVKIISSVDRSVLKAGATRRTTDRVQVTVMGETYPQVKQILALVRAAAADRLGAIAGATDVAVHTDAAGPDLSAGAGIHFQSQDFKVSYNLQA